MKIDKKKQQLGVSSRASGNRLKKLMLFRLAKQLDMHFCFRCGEEILHPDDFAIDHKIPWLDSEDPKKLFWDLDNIAFSHSNCNSKAARHKIRKHPSRSSYDAGCRCERCCLVKSIHKKDTHAKWKLKQKQLL